MNENHMWLTREEKEAIIDGLCKRTVCHQCNFADLCSHSLFGFHHLPEDALDAMIANGNNPEQSPLHIGLPERFRLM